MVFGAPCSGKSTFAKKFAEKFGLAYYNFDEIKKNSGYINGFAAEYYVASLSISDGKEGGEEFFVGYILHMPDYNQNFIVAVTSKVLSTESLSNSEAYAVSVINTL